MNIPFLVRRVHRVRSFPGFCEGEKKVAYYPYSKDVTYDGTKISYDMPVSYTYKSENSER